MGRLKGKSKGNHNDRTFDTSKNKSIIYPEDAKYNQYYVVDGNGKFQPVKANTNAFVIAEKNFYREHFKEGQDAKNERNKAQGHKERCKTIEQVRKAPKTAPMELVLQIGSDKKPYNDMGNTARMMRQMASEIRSKYPNFKIINMAIHYDELTPHAQIRGAFMAKDKFGYTVPNQTQALQEMGFYLPDPTKPRGQYNNELVRFTRELRKRWYDLIEEMEPEITIDRTPIENVTHQDQRKRKKEDIEDLEKLYDEVQRNLRSTDWGKLEAMESFIETKGLEQEFANYEFEFVAKDYD